jgi:hypothetical protein
MGEIRLSEFQGDTIVVHFGGPPTIDAYTFAEALIGFADTARAISGSIDPGQDVEIVLVADASGSYRAVIRRVKKGYGGILSGAAGAVFWGVVANVVYDATLKSDPPPQITVNTNEVIVKHGPHTVIIPRTVHDASENAKKSPAVQRGLKKTFEPLQADKKVTDFGLTRQVDDPEPLIKIPRADFPLVVSQIALMEEQPTERTKTERARLVILKAWLNQAKSRETQVVVRVERRASLRTHCGQAVPRSARPARAFARSRRRSRRGNQLQTNV